MCLVQSWVLSTCSVNNSFPEISQNSFCYNFSFGGVSCTQCEISASVWEKHGWLSLLPPHSTQLDLVHLPFPASGWRSLFLLGYPCLISSLLCSGFKVPPSPLLIFHCLIHEFTVTDFIFRIPACEYTQAHLDVPTRAHTHTSQLLSTV